MNNQILGNQIIKLASVDSTNNYIAKLVNKTKVSFGTVIMADFQSIGRGDKEIIYGTPKKEKNLLF